MNRKGFNVILSLIHQSEIWVFDPGGEHLGTIEVPESVGNINWGDDDWRSLYIPSSTSVYRVRMKVAGNRLGYMH